MFVVVMLTNKMNDLFKRIILNTPEPNIDDFNKVFKLS